MKTFIFIFLCFLISMSVQALSAERYIIESVPFFPSEDYQCGPASLASVLVYLGIIVTPDDISKEIYSSGAKGTADFDMVLYPLKKGLKTTQYRGSLEDLREKIKEGKPLIVMTDEGVWFYKKYHYMVVVGFDSSKVIVNSEKEKHKKIDIDDFVKKWQKTDFWTLLIERVN